jgi:hypothetical protein
MKTSSEKHSWKKKILLASMMLPCLSFSGHTKDPSHELNAFFETQKPISVSIRERLQQLWEEQKVQREPEIQSVPQTEKSSSRFPSDVAKIKGKLECWKEEFEEKQKDLFPGNPKKATVRLDEISVEYEKPNGLNTFFKIEKQDRDLKDDIRTTVKFTQSF